MKGFCRPTVIVLAVFTFASTTASPARGQVSDTKLYICPMYCTDEVSETRGFCSVCKMQLEEKEVVENPEGYTVISPEEALDLMRSDSNLVLLDVRTVREYNGKLGHLPDAILIPIKELAGRLGELTPYKGRPFIAYCSHGIRSGTAAKILTNGGFTAMSLMGGLTKWNRDGYPVLRE